MATDLALKISQLPIQYQILIYCGMFLIMIIAFIFGTTSEEK